MKTAIIIAVLFFLVIVGIPRFVRGALRRREMRAKRITDALALIEAAGLTAYSEAEEAKRKQKLDQAVADLKGAGYKISPK